MQNILPTNSVWHGGAAGPRGEGWGHLAQSGLWLSEGGPCLSPIELARLGLPESSRHLLFTSLQACQGFGAQGTAFL